MIPTGEKSAYYFSQMTQSQNSAASQSSQPILPPNPVVVHAAFKHLKHHEFVYVIFQ